MKTQQNEKIGTSSFPEYTENPFITSMVVKQRNQTLSISKNPLNIVNTDTGEIEDVAFYHIKKRVDNEQFVKIFMNHIQILFDLSPRGLKVLGYFMKALRINNDMVIFGMEDCKKYSGYKSNNSIFYGLGELLNKNIIAKCGTFKNTFFINPTIIFNGNRLVLINDYHKRKTNSLKDPNQLKLIPNEEFNKNTEEE